MSTHAVKSGSGTYEWMECAASVPMSIGIEDRSGLPAYIGSAAHTLGEHCLLTGDLPMDYLGEPHPDKRYADVEIDEDMVNAVSVYVQHILNYGFYLSKDNIEVRVSLEAMGDWAKGMFGTADFLATDRLVLLVDDYKHGQGVVVEAPHNPQLKYYAVGALTQHGLWDTVKQVRTTVIQPRAPHAAGPVRHHTYSVAELREWVDEELKPASLRVDAAMAAFEETGEVPAEYFNPGQKQCMFCKAKGFCKALAEKALDSAGMEFNEMGRVDSKKPRVRLTADELADILSNESFFMKWFKGVNEYALLSAQHGKDVTNGRFKLVAGRSSRAWKGEASAKKHLISLGYDEKDLFKQSFITPAQAEKMIGKKQAATLTDLIAVKEGKPTLAPADDKRPALSVTPEDDFTD